MGLLDGIRVLDLASVGPAARASRWLADYGADVIKVAPVPAHDGVQIQPPFHAYSAHRGLRRVQLDLKAAEGREAFLRLADRTDVVIESFRPGVVDRLGIGPDDVAARNRRAVYCSTTGYGQHGPRAGWAGHDLNYLAAGGFLACSTPGTDGRPPIPGATVADSAAGGMQAVMSILAALVARDRTGQGARLDVSVADGVVALMALAIDEQLATGARQGPRSGLLTGRYACYELYRCRDGRWLTVAAIEPKFWANLCRHLGLERWTHHQLDDDRQADIRADLEQVFAGRDRDDWVAELGPADTCVAAVTDVGEVVDDAHFAARGLFVDAVHPRAGAFPQLGPVLAGAERPEEPVPVRDMSETDTDALLAEAGYRHDERVKLREAGVVA